MKIAIDARELEGRRTGVGRYLHEILRACARDAQRWQPHEFVLCSTAPVDLSPYDRLRVSSLTAPGQGVTWEQFVLPGLLARTKPDLLFAPGYTAPLLGATPTVLVVHDVSFSSHPEWFSWREGARRRTVTRLAARRAAKVVTVSQFSKHEIEAHLDVEPAKVVVIPNGVTRLSPPARREEDEPTVLYVGSIFNRRNVPALIDAVGLLAADGRRLRLEIVGDNRTTPHIDLEERVRAANLLDRVRIRSYVDEAELAACYAGARAFAFLSDYEGFGLTPLEALSADLPILVLDRPTTREICGDAATYIRHPTPREIAAGLTRALYDEAERARVLAAAPGVLARFSWSDAAARLFQIFEAVAHAGRRSRMS